MEETMSSTFKLADRGGNTLTFRRDGDVFFTPWFPGNRVVNLPGFKLRDDDVLICGWMRSGTHWTWEMVSMLMNKKAETIPKFKEEHMFEYAASTYLDALPSPRVFNTHLKFGLLPDAMKTRPIKVIFLMRNPRDAICSWYTIHRQHEYFEYSGRWEDWLPGELDGSYDWGSWFDYVREWERDLAAHPNVKAYILHYENTLKDPMGELRKISKFLECDADENLLMEIADKCHIERMRNDKMPYESCQDIHYKHGKSGTWKSRFTVEQYELFEKLYREKMAGSMFEEMYRGPVEEL